MSEWKPGDVAVLAYTFADGGRALRVSGCKSGGHPRGDHWHFANGSHGDGSGAQSIRPLAAIDPEDFKAVKAFADSIVHIANGDLDDQPISRFVGSVGAALREFAAPTPPKPDEPTGPLSDTEIAMLRRVLMERDS